MLWRIFCPGLFGHRFRPHMLTCANIILPLQCQLCIYPRFLSHNRNRCCVFFSVCQEGARSGHGNGTYHFSNTGFGLFLFFFFGPGFFDILLLRFWRCISLWFVSCVLGGQEDLVGLVLFCFFCFQSFWVAQLLCFIAW